MDAVKSSSEARALGARPRVAPVEAVAIAEEVASSLRHDLRNKFAAIRNAVYYIERSLTKSQMIAHDPRIARFLELVCEQLNAADGLLDQRGRNEALLQTATEPIRLGACVQAALVRRVVPAGISVLTDLADQSEVQANSDEVMLAIDCLLDNAFEAVGLSGTVTVKTAEDPSVVRLSVEDTGPGMTETAARASSRAVLEREAGPSRARAQHRSPDCRAPRRHARFVRPGCRVRDSMGIDHPETLLSGRVQKLLLVEDDASNRLTLVAVLEDAGFEVTEAATYAEAERLLRAGPFEMVVLDRGLGTRDGAELASLARAASVTARVVVLSGSDAAGGVLDVDAWVTKGAGIAELLAALRPSGRDRKV